MMNSGSSFFLLWPLFWGYLGCLQNCSVLGHQKVGDLWIFLCVHVAVDTLGTASFFLFFLILLYLAFKAFALAFTLRRITGASFPTFGTILMKRVCETYSQGYLSFLMNVICTGWVKCMWSLSLAVPGWDFHGQSFESRKVIVIGFPERGKNKLSAEEA